MLLTLLASVPAIDSDGIIRLVITIIIVGLVFWLLTWAIGYIGVPEPFNKVIKVILVLAVVIWLMKVLLGLI